MIRRRVGPPLALCLMGALGSCTLAGGHPRGLTPPAGIGLSLEFEEEDRARLTGLERVPDRVLRGEAVSMEPRGLLFRTDTSTTSSTHPDTVRLLLIEEPVLRLAEIREASDRPRRRGRRLDAGYDEELAYIARWARYPEALSPTQREALVAEFGEPIVVAVRRTGGAHELGPPDVPSREDFLARARLAGERFRDRRVAIREGYRRLGPDFPGMGEHWVHPGRAVSGRIVAEEPPVLGYVVVDGEPLLTGVAWTVPLLPGQRPPPSPLGDRVWHDHSGTLDEEALLLDSPRTHEHRDDPHAGRDGGSQDGKPRLSMVHAWLWVPNPEGVLAQNNWALPYVRVGLQAPGTPDPGASRALSLAGSGAHYYQTLLVRAARAAGRDREVITDGVRDASRRVNDLVARRTDADSAGTPTGRRLDASDQAALHAEWAGLWANLEAQLSPQAWDRLRPAYETWSTPGIR